MSADTDTDTIPCPPPQVTVPVSLESMVGELAELRGQLLAMQAWLADELADIQRRLELLTQSVDLAVRQGQSFGKRLTALEGDR